MKRIKTHLYFLFLDIKVDEIHLRRRQWSLHPAKSIPWLLMSWRRKEPGHQHPWYWPSYPGIFRVPQQTGWQFRWSIEPARLCVKMFITLKFGRWLALGCFRRERKTLYCHLAGLRLREISQNNIYTRAASWSREPGLLLVWSLATEGV